MRNLFAHFPTTALIKHEMKRILFVCHGNICRSPMAEIVFRDMLRRKGLENAYEVASAATSTEELGNPVYPPARAELAAHGLSAAGKYAVQLTRRDYEHYDLLVAMDDNNVRNMHRMLSGDPQGKICKLLSFTGEAGNVADPWFTGRFAETFADVERGCRALLDALERE